MNCSDTLPVLVTSQIQLLLVSKKVWKSGPEIMDSRQHCLRDQLNDSCGHVKENIPNYKPEFVGKHTNCSVLLSMNPKIWGLPVQNLCSFSLQRMSSSWATCLQNVLTEITVHGYFVVRGKTGFVLYASVALERGWETLDSISDVIFQHGIWWHLHTVLDRKS